MPDTPTAPKVAGGPTGHRAWTSLARDVLDRASPAARSSSIGASGALPRWVKVGPAGLGEAVLGVEPARPGGVAEWSTDARRRTRHPASRPARPSAGPSRCRCPRRPGQEAEAPNTAGLVVELEARCCRRRGHWPGCRGLGSRRGWRVAAGWACRPTFQKVRMRAWDEIAWTPRCTCGRTAAGSSPTAAAQPCRGADPTIRLTLVAHGRLDSLFPQVRKQLLTHPGPEPLLYGHFRQDGWPSLLIVTGGTEASAWCAAEASHLGAGTTPCRRPPRSWTG